MSIVWMRDVLIDLAKCAENESCDSLKEAILAAAGNDFLSVMSDPQSSLAKRRNLEFIYVDSPKQGSKKTPL